MSGEVVTPNLETLADRVWYAWHCLPRGEKGKLPTLRTLERTFGLPESILSALFGGRRTSISLETAKRVASALNVTLDWLVTGIGRRPVLTGECRPRGRFSAADEMPRLAKAYLTRIGCEPKRVERALAVLFDSATTTNGEGQ